MDYAQIIDSETWAFIRETDSWYPPETATFPIDRQREIYDAMCRAFHRGYPDGLSVEDRPMGGVPSRLYTPAPPPARHRGLFPRRWFCRGGLAQPR